MKSCLLHLLSSPWRSICTALCAATCRLTVASRATAAASSAKASGSAAWRLTGPRRRARATMLPSSSKKESYRRQNEWETSKNLSRNGWKTD